MDIVRRWARPALILFLSATSTGCLYTQVTQPLAYRSNSFGDVQTTAGRGDHAVFGEACAHVILGLIAVGDAGYEAALANAGVPTGADLSAYDVKADAETFGILGFIYARRCTKVSALAVTR